MPTARKGESARQVSMSLWVGAVQASKPVPVKAGWPVRGRVATAGLTGSAAGGPAVAGVTVRARARSSRTASGLFPYDRVAITPGYRRA